MSAQGNLDWIAAKVGEIEKAMQATSDKRLDAFKGLLSSVESSLADLVANIERGGGAAAIDAMAAAIGKLRLPDVTVTPQITVQPANVQVDVKVPDQPAPVVNVEVSPTPVTFSPQMPAMPEPVIHVMPAGDMVLDITFTKDRFGDIEGMTIVRRAAGK